MLRAWTFALRPLLKASSSRNVRCTVYMYGDGSAVTTRAFPCYPTERAALSYMADRLRRTAAFE